MGFPGSNDSGTKIDRQNELPSRFAPGGNALTLAPLFPPMKTTAFALPALLFAALPLRAADLPPQIVYQTSRIQIDFHDPGKYTDIRDQLQPTAKGEESILRQLADAMESDAKYEVPRGDRLELTFNNIKLAGDFEPWHGPLWDQIRVVRDIYIPFFDFTYRLTDSSGRVVKQGTEHLSDMNFQWLPVINDDDPLRYEKAILDNWMQGHIKH